MPNAKVLSEKQAIVAELKQKIQNASAGVLVDYKGITVAEDTELRSQLRQNNVEYSVVKNTMVRRAIDGLGLDAMGSVLNGTTSLAIGNDDPILPIRLVSEYSKKLKGKVTIKAAFAEGKLLTPDQVEAFGNLPSKSALQSQVLGTFLAPITGLAVVLNQILEAKGGAGEAAAE